MGCPGIETHTHRKVLMHTIIRHIPYWIWLLTLVVGCSQNPPPPPPPEAEFIGLNLTIANAQGNPIDAKVTITVDTVEGPGATLTQTGARLGFRLLIGPTARPGWGATITAEAPDYITYSYRFVLPEKGDNELPTLVMQPSHLSAGQLGRLTRTDFTLLANGEPFVEIGYSHFTLAERVCRGEDVDALIEDVVRLGFNTVRVLGMYDGGLGHFTLVTEDRGRWRDCIKRMVQLVGLHHMRVLFTVFADAQRVVPDPNTQQDIWNQTIETLAPEWNVRLELVNEWQQNGVDPFRFSYPSNHQLLYSRGSGVGESEPLAPWDVLDNHPGRLPEWVRRVPCREHSANLGVPCMESEPIGFAEEEVDGRRTNSAELAAQFGLLCTLHSSGCTFHSDGGIMGTALEPNQLAAAKAFVLGMRFAPAGAVLWPYQRGDQGSESGFGNMPILHDDGLELRSYCKSAGIEAWCVQSATRREHATGRDGWVVISEPAKGLVYLVHPIAGPNLPNIPLPKKPVRFEP